MGNNKPPIIKPGFHDWEHGARIKMPLAVPLTYDTRRSTQDVVLWQAKIWMESFWFHQSTPERWLPSSLTCKKRTEHHWLVQTGSFVPLLWVEFPKPPDINSHPSQKWQTGWLDAMLTLDFCLPFYAGSSSFDQFTWSIRYWIVIISVLVCIISNHQPTGTCLPKYQNLQAAHPG